MKRSLLLLSIICATTLKGFGQIDSLRQVLQSAVSDTNRIKTYYALASGFDDFDSTLFYLTRGIDTATPDWPYLRGVGLRRIGLTYFYANAIDSALVYLESAIHAFDQVLPDKKQDQRVWVLGETHYQTAVPYYYKGAYSKALSHLRKALKLFEEDRSHIVAIRCYGLLGIIHFAQGEMVQAEEQLKNGIVMALESRQEKTLGGLYNNLASVYMEQKAYEKASVQYKASLKYVDPSDELSIAQTNMNLGLVNLRMRLFDKAKEYLLADQAFFERTTHLRTRITWRNMLGELYLAEEDWEKVVATSQQTLKELEDLPLVIIQQSALNQLSLGYAGMQEYELAYQYHQAYVNLKDSLFEEDRTREIKRLEAQLEFDQKEREIGELTQANLEKELALKEERNNRNLLLFSALGAFALLGVVWLIYQRREESKRHALDMRRLEIEQRMLRSQMNPHFIFNALNSIQSFVSTNQTYKAEVYMSDFSMLMRQTLENSMHETIPIAQEVALLRLYLKLEKQRFGDLFDYEITEYADETISLPPMLLQPFVENAIVHGMKGKKEGGMIRVLFTEQEDTICCEVMDNGVGRHPGSSHEAHHSYATRLTSDRIGYLNESTGEGGYGLQIIDLKNEDGTARGTHVKLTLPL